MIKQALTRVEEDLNSHLGRNGDGDLERVTFTSLVGTDGGPNTSATERIVGVLTGIDEERNALEHQARPAGPLHTRRSTPLNLNLRLLFAANYGDYKTGLHVLWRVMEYLQAKPVFDDRNTPELPDGVRQLTFTMAKLDTTELSNLWSYLGVSYLPSVVYNVRLIGAMPGKIREVVLPIEKVVISP